MVVSISKNIFDLYVKSKINLATTINTTLGYINFKQSSMICTSMFESNSEKVEVELPNELVEEAQNLFSLQLNVDEMISILLLTGFVMGVCE